MRAVVAAIVVLVAALVGLQQAGVLSLTPVGRLADEGAGAYRSALPAAAQPVVSGEAEPVIMERQDATAPAEFAAEAAPAREIVAVTDTPAAAPTGAAAMTTEVAAAEIADADAAADAAADVAPQPVPEPATAPAPAAAPAEGTSYYIHISSFLEPERAQAEMARFTSRGLSCMLQESAVAGQVWRRVLLGPYPDRDAALGQANRLIDDRTIRYYHIVRRDVAGRS